MKKTYDSKFKSRVALEALRGELTIAEIASKYQIHPNQVQRWKQRLMEGASDIFGNRLDIRSMPAIVSISIYTYHVKQNSPVPRRQGRSCPLFPGQDQRP